MLPVSAILGIVNTRLIISHFGEGAFAQYGLLVGIAALIPFADLGITAAIINAIGKSDDPGHDPEVRQVLVTAMRIVTCSCVVVLAVAAGITLVDAWPTLLGEGLLPHSGNLAAGLCLAVFGLTLLVGFGQQVLTGLGKNHISVLLLGLQTPAVLLTVLLLIGTHAPLGGYVAVAAYAATFLVSVVAVVIAARRLRPAFRVALHDAPRVRTVRGGRIFGMAWPMVVQMIALPLAMQTDRLVLSHVSDLQDLAKYNLASQMFTPVWAVVSSAGVALWPIFARARSQDVAHAPSPFRMSFSFGATAALVCLALGLASDWLATKASGGVIHLGVALVATFSVFMILQAVKYPLGMYMTDARGLRYQALMIVFLLLPLNLALSWVLAIRWGAVGPVVGSAVSVLLTQVVGNWIYVRRDLRRRASEAVEVVAE